MKYFQRIFQNLTLKWVKGEEKVKMKNGFFWVNVFDSNSSKID